MLNGKNIIKSTILILSLFFLMACREDKDDDVQPDESYSFFIAGHTYGGAGVDNVGLHPPFEEKFGYLNTRKVDLGFLTGDIVIRSTEQNWNEVDSVLQYLDAKVYYVPGNHDFKVNPDLFESRYGPTYSYFKKYDDLFIMLDPNIDHWNISGNQLEFLKETLRLNPDVRNIFVFFHQLLWRESDNKYRYVRVNSTEGRDDTINFWTEVMPLFTQRANPVVMFAGDMGAASWSSDYMYDTFDNITLIGSGMGEGIGDNIIIIDVDEWGNIDYDLIAINGADIHALGELEDYELPTSIPANAKNLIKGD